MRITLAEIKLKDVLKRKEVPSDCGLILGVFYSREIAVVYFKSELLGKVLKRYNNWYLNKELAKI